MTQSLQQKHELPASACFTMPHAATGSDEPLHQQHALAATIPYKAPGSGAHHNHQQNQLCMLHTCCGCLLICLQCRAHTSWFAPQQ
jgi:hypothetical protein